MTTRHRRMPSRDRYRDSSPTDSRPRTRTYKDNSDSYTTDYSDDFERDSRGGSVTPPRARKRDIKPRKRSVNPYSSDQSTIQLHSSATSKKSSHSLGRGYNRTARRTTGPRKHGWKTHSLSKDTPQKSSRDNIAARMLSAKQRKMNELQNELFDSKQRLEELQKENRLLKTLQHRQDKALRKFEDAESDLPRLISQNAEDQRVLKARLRKTQGAERALENKLRENNDEMQKMEAMLRRLKKIVYDKNLGERSELARQLTNTENQLTVAERKVKELEKKLELTVSSFTRQINTERHKHKDTKEKLDALHEDFINIQAKLKEKERALDVSNIYSLRKKEPSDKALVPSSVSSTPRRHFENLTSSATQTDLAVTPVSSTSDINRSVVLATKPIPTKTKNEPDSNSDGFAQDFRKTIKSPTVTSPKSPIFMNAKKEKAASSTGLNGLHVNKKEKQQSDNKQSVFLTANFDSPLSSTNTSFIAESKAENNPGSELPTEELDVKQDRLEKLLNEAKEQQQVLEEERKKAQEVQTQKMELLAKMREIEEESTKNVLTLDASKKPTSLSKTVTMNPQSKAQLVKSLLGNDTDPIYGKLTQQHKLTGSLQGVNGTFLKHCRSVKSEERTRKLYQFTREVENLHLGIPSNANEKKSEKPEREISFGSYAPTVGGAPLRRKVRPSNRAAKTGSSESENDEPLFDLNSGKNNKKSDLLTQLFGSQEKPNGLNDTPMSSFLSDGKQGTTSGNDVTPRAKPVHSGYPWEKNVITNLKGNGDSSNSTNKIVSSSSLKSNPPTNDDEIEELIL